jgi:hypothetical protein
MQARSWDRDKANKKKNNPILNKSNVKKWNWKEKKNQLKEN